MTKTKKQIASQGAKQRRIELTYRAYVKMHVQVLLRSKETDEHKVEKFIILLKQLRLDLVDDVTRFDEYIVSLMNLRENFNQRRFKTLLTSFYRNFVICRLITTLTPITSIEIPIEA